MTAPRFIARRLTFQGKMAMITIALSFFVMILAVSISSGFRREIRRGVSDISGDIMLCTPDMNYIGGSNPIGTKPSYLSQIENLDGVVSVSPAIFRAGMVKSGDSIEGVLFKGIENVGESLEVSIPSKLSVRLGLNVGDEMVTYFISEKIKVRKFKVASIYQSILDTDDKLVVKANLEDMQRLEGWEEDQASALEIKLSELYQNSKLTKGICDFIGMTAILDVHDDEDMLYATSAMDRYPQLFSWLDLIDFNVFFIILLMTIVAGFNMISGLLIMLFRNIGTIGILKSMGMTDKSISSVFLRVASTLVLKGMLIGNALGFLFCLIQGKTHLLKLNPENYFVSFVPTHINVIGVLSADIAAYVVIMLLLLIPCLFISRVDPAQTVRTN